ncbi:MAG: hypothetical protein J0L61_11680, partial [Planctomycetes bacterium]|nr:hypothetical protein [Planctomycetota bacterium]
RSILDEGGPVTDRVTIDEFTPSSEFFESYSKIDVQLDPFPYNGTTTTCESLWMGVPVLTIEGRWHAARVGTSLLRVCGLEQFIAADLSDYIAKAVDIATRPGDLAQTRAGLRRRIEKSPLRDEARYAKAFGDALRRAWADWCARA